MIQNFHFSKNSSEDDGFVETILEIKSPTKSDNKEHENGLLPEANPIYQRAYNIIEYKYNINSDKFLRLFNRSLSKSQSLTQTQTLFDRYNDTTEFQQIYRRYEGIIKDPKQNVTSLYKQQFDVTQLFPKQKKKCMFDSGFESGNLCSAYQVKDSNVYELLMHNDSNTKGYTQWFNFSLQNPKHQQITIRIVNFVKSSSHFKNGMKPILSQQGVEIVNLSYLRNNFTRITVKNGNIEYKTYYTLQFDVMYLTPVSTNKLYISMNYPYTREKLQKFLSAHSIPSLQLTKTLLGYDCPYFIITNQNIVNVIKKKVIIIARQHPGETVSSYVMEGVISFLQGNSIESSWLKDQVEFHIFPMINIDGVQAGNFRCDLTGKDLNRIWDRPNKTTHPVIYQLKRMIKKMVNSNTSIDFFIDLHGHSKKLNNFLYGCRNDTDPVGCRLYPKLMEALCPFFRFEDCTFSMSKHKIKTARAIVYYAMKDREQTTLNAFTLETSFYGYEKEGNVIQFSIPDLLSIGSDLIRSLYVYWGGHIVNNSKSSQEDINKYANIDLDSIRQELLCQTQKFKEMDDKLEGCSEGEQMGSDSEAENDILTEQERDAMLLPQVECQTINEIQNKPKSKSVSNPEHNKFNQTEKGITQIKNILKPVIKSQIKNSKYPEETNTPQLSIVQRQQTPQRGYLANKRSKNLEVILPSNMRVYAQYTQEQSKIEQERAKKNLVQYVLSPKEVIQKQNTGSIENYFSNNLIPAFQITRQYFKKQVKKSYETSRLQKTKAKSLMVPTQSYFKNEQLEILQQKQQTQQFDPRVSLQIEELKNELIVRQNQQMIPKPKINQNDMMMTQLLRNIWTMNQIKYGQQLKQPKQYKPLQKDEEDIRIFDDKKIQSATRFVNQKRIKNRDNDKLFPL